MKLLRQGFYLLIGFTFPGFWIFHAAGFWSMLYRPIQLLFGTESSGWPSLLTGALLYLGAVILFEVFYRLLRNAHP